MVLCSLLKNGGEKEMGLLDSLKNMKDQVVKGTSTPEPVKEAPAAAPVKPKAAPAPAPRQAAPGFLFGDDSVNSRVQAAREPEAAPAPAPAQEPAPAPQPIPVQSHTYSMPQQPAAPAPAGQYGGKPQVNVTPAEAPAAPRTAKPWFMFGSKDNNQ